MVTYTSGRDTVDDNVRLLRVAGDITWQDHVKRAQDKLALLPATPKPSAKRKALYDAERAAYGEPGPKADTAWLLKRHQYPDFMRVTIYPEQFERLVEQGVTNREVKDHKVEMLARMMRQNRFFFIHLGMASDQEGKFQDGKNRALASMAADKPIDILYCVGMPVRNFVYLDSGTPRTAKDTVDIALAHIKRQERNAYQLGTALGIGLQYEMWGEQTHRGWNRFIITNDEKLEALERYGDALREGVRVGFRLRSQLKIGTSVGAAAVAYHRLCEVAPSDVVNSFFGALGEGGAAAKSPLNTLRNHLLRNTEDGRRVPQGSRRNDVFVQLALYIKAWNLTMEGAKVGPKGIQFDTLNEDFPLPTPFQSDVVSLAAV